MSKCFAVMTTYIRFAMTHFFHFYLGIFVSIFTLCITLVKHMHHLSNACVTYTGDARRLSDTCLYNIHVYLLATWDFRIFDISGSSLWHIDLCNHVNLQIIYKCYVLCMLCRKSSATIWPHTRIAICIHWMLFPYMCMNNH